MNREAILGALFDLVGTAQEFKTKGRRVKLWTEISLFPALFVQLTGADYAAREIRRLPPIRTLAAEIWIYTDGGKNPHTTPEEALNNAVDAVEAVLQHRVSEQTQTLGGLVSHCWIEGEIEHYPGTLDNVAKAIIPIRMLVP